MNQRLEADLEVPNFGLIDWFRRDEEVGDAFAGVCSSEAVPQLEV
jgi:hypothetical protein